MFSMLKISVPYLYWRISSIEVQIEQTEKQTTAIRLQLASLCIMGAQLKALPLKPLGPSQHYSIVGFKGGP